MEMFDRNKNSAFNYNFVSKFNLILLIHYFANLFAKVKKKSLNQRKEQINKDQLIRFLNFKFLVI